MPHRSSRRCRNRIPQDPMSADCRPAPCARRVAAAGQCERQFMHSGIVPDQHQPFRIGCGGIANGFAGAARDRRRRVPAAVPPRAPARAPSSPPRRFPRSAAPAPREKPARARERRMPADPAADLGGIIAAAVVKSAVLIAAAWRVVFGLGVTKQHQTAHGGFRFVIRTSQINLLCRGQGQGDKRQTDPLRQRI